MAMGSSEYFDWSKHYSKNAFTSIEFGRIENLLAALNCMFYNANKEKDAKPLKPDNFMPWIQKEYTASTEDEAIQRSLDSKNAFKLQLAGMKR